MARKQVYNNFKGAGAGFKKAWREVIDDLGRQAIVEYAESLYESLLEKTPVDTGKARGSWTIHLSGGSPDNGPGSSASHTGQSMTAGERAYFKSKIRAFLDGNAKDIIFTNVSGYAAPLEYGHSKKSPDGMARRTVAQYGPGTKTYQVKGPRGHALVHIVKI